MIVGLLKALMEMVLGNESNPEKLVSCYRMGLLAYHFQTRESVTPKGRLS